MFRQIDEGPLVQCWPTPVYVEQMPDSMSLNERLARAVIDDSKRRPGSRNSNAKGWQSPDDLFVQANEDIQSLLHLIGAAAQRMNTLIGSSDRDPSNMVAEGWATLNRAGDHHDVHIHHASVWSGTYYVQVPAPAQAASPDEGAIEFLDPRHAARDSAQAPVFTLRPLAGMLILFPSWLQHWVRPHMQPSARISIAFNLRYP